MVGTDKPDKKSETKLKTTPADIDEYLKSDDFKAYIQIATLTGQLTKPFEELSILEQRQTISNYHQWVKLDRPKPKMPEMPMAAVKSPVDIFRIKHRGKEKIYWDNTAGEKIGVTFKDGNPVDYTIDYTDAKADELMAEREQLLDPNQRRNCYIVLDGRIHIVHDIDFKKPFDELAKALKEESYHF